MMTDKTIENMSSDELRKALDSGAVAEVASKKVNKAARDASNKANKANRKAAKKTKKTPAKKAAKASKRKAVKASRKARKLTGPRDSKTLEIARFMVNAKGGSMTSALAKKFKVRIVQCRRAAKLIVRLGGKVETKKSEKATGKPGRRAHVYTVTKVPDTLKK